jgi:hypothetical protein
MLNAHSNFNMHETPEEIEKDVIIPNEPGKLVKEIN